MKIFETMIGVFESGQVTRESILLVNANDSKQIVNRKSTHYIAGELHYY